MKKIFGSDKVYVMESKITGAGRGVFAGRDIKKGELIEKCPIIEVPAGDMVKLNQSVLVAYFFYYGEDQSLVALGFGSIYNHSYEPNAKYEIKSEEMVIDFVASGDIKKDDEIMVNYKGESGSKNPLWFE